MIIEFRNGAEAVDGFLSQAALGGLKWKCQCLRRTRGEDGNVCKKWQHREAGEENARA